MTKKQIQQFQTRLIDELTKLYSLVHSEIRRSMVRQMFGDDEPRDEGDESLRLQLRDARMSLAENEARRAQEIEAALERIRAGTFGMCIECDQPIERGRLQALPWAARCFEDQSALERQRQERAPTL